MDFWEWLQSVIGQNRGGEQPLQLDWRGRGSSQNVEDHRRASPQQNYGSFSQAKVGFLPDEPMAPFNSQARGLQSSPFPTRRGWNEQLTSDMVRTPQLPTSGSLKNAIWAVLSGEAERFTNEIHPNQFGGQNNPVILDELTVMPAPDLNKEQHLLDSLGVLPQQRRQSWTEEQARRIYNATSPYGAGYYSDSPEEMADRARKLILGGDIPEREIDPELSASEDAWALYLGLPQKFGTWQVSPYTPSQSKDPSVTYLRSPEIWHDLMGWNLLPADHDPTNARPVFSDSDGTVRRILELIGPSGKTVVSGGNLMDQEGWGPDGEFMTSTVPFALADFTLSIGSDKRGPYISLYDVWDLDRIPGADNVGQPFEIYDRLYFDPNTLQPIWDARQPQQRRRRFPSRR